MNLKLTNHDYKYAVEQILLSMFPDERPVYVDDAEPGDCARISLERGDTVCRAQCELRIHDVLYTGTDEIDTDKLTDTVTENRLLQRIVKFAFYRAALRYTGRKPVWGALTGIRPGKIASDIMDTGGSAQSAVELLTGYYEADLDRARLCAETAAASLEVKNNLHQNAVALYVGIPFCPTRCAYCSFVSNSVEKSFALIPPFLDSLYREIEATAAVCETLELHPAALYIGGGTPTVLSADELDTLCGKLAECFTLGSLTEYCVEAGRPETITRDKLEVLKRHGVDRVSVNPQSMRGEVLEAIGRRHSAADIRDAFRLVREIGGFAVNMDLIAGLPRDSAAGFSETLDQIIDLNPENITVHTLSLKKGSKISLDGVTIPRPEEVGTMLDTSNTALRDAGYSPYYLYRQKFTSGGFENVGWSKKGYASVYNICIMEEHCSIISMGGGASTKLVTGTGRIERIFNPKYPREYIRDTERLCSGKERIVDFYNGLRNK